MVSTRSRRSGVEKDENRIIAIVTGANSGFGLGICHLLLSSLSLPEGTPIPYSIPQATALSPSQSHLIPETTSSTFLKATSTDNDSRSKIKGKATTFVSDDKPLTLTLILACRSGKKAAEAIEIVKKKHFKELEKRRRKGIAVREGWLEGLKIVWEPVELGNVGGKNGVLTFCERIKETYPHVTSLFLNAGVTMVYGLDYFGFARQILKDGLIYSVTHPVFHMQKEGATTEDGERGFVWSVNVLSPYIMIRELLPLLDASPSDLPLPPRIILTSSVEAEYTVVPPNIIQNDHQLLETRIPYQVSKYFIDVVMQELDQEINASREEKGERTVRCLLAEPGIVQTNIVAGGLGASRIIFNFQWAMSFLALYFVRLLGSKHHPTFVSEGALPIMYAAMIPDKYLVSPSIVPAQKLGVITSRFKGAKVGYGEVDEWERAKEDGLGRGMVDRCEVVRKEWRRREGLE